MHKQRVSRPGTKEEEVFRDASRSAAKASGTNTMDSHAFDETSGACEVYSN